MRKLWAILAVTMMLSLSAAFAANANEFYVDENGIPVFERDEEAVAQLYEEAQNVTVVLPVKPMSEEEAAAMQAAAENAELMSDEEKTVVVERVSANDFHLSGETIKITVRFEEFYDAKNKLEVAIVDSNDNVVAEQIGCEYVHGWNNDLQYTLEVVDDAEISNSDSYSVKLTYTGVYSFVCNTYTTQIYPNGQAAIMSAWVANKSENLFAFRIANFDAEADYAIEYNGEKYEPVSIEDNCITVEIDEIKAYETYTSLTFNLYEWKANYNYYSYCDYCFVNYFDFSEQYDPEYNPDYDYYRGTSSVGKIAVNQEYFWVYIYEKENGFMYTSDDAENADVYMIDPVSGEKVGTATVECDDYYQLDAKVTITEDLVCDRTYIIVIDDGETIRLRKVTAIDGPIYRFCGVKRDDTYYSSSFIVADKYEFVVFDAYNMPDVSKISAVMYDADGNEVITFNKGSAKKSSNRITFTMKRKAELVVGEEYYFEFMYDGEVVEKSEWYCSSGEDSSDFDAWVLRSYRTDDETYVLLEYHSEEYDADDLKFVLENFATEEKLTGEYQRTLCVDYYDVIVIKFDGAFEDDSEDVQLTIKKGSTELYSYSHMYIEYTTLPFVYNYTNRTQDGYVMLYGEGFKDGSTYDLYLLDLVENAEKKINLPKVKGKDEFKIPADDLNIMFNQDGYIEEDGVCVARVDYWNLRADYVPGTEFYAKYKYQDHNIVILCLPFEEYAQYKIADSEDELSSESFNKIKRNVLYTVPEGEGEKTVYAQFKKSNGELSDIMKTTVIIDTTAPVMSDISDLSGTYSIGEYQDFEVSVSLTASEDGQLYILFYNAEGARIGYDRSISVNKGQNQNRFYFYSDDYEDYTKAKKLAIYMVDNVGNKSETYYYDISVVSMYTQYEIADGYLVFNNETGTIEEVYVDATSLTIPSSINDITVKAIDNYAFEYCSGVETISIPESVESIYPNAFWGLDVTLKVRENSYAHMFALNNGMNFEILTAIPGDVTGDGEVSRMDLLRLAKHFSGWSVEIDEAASDVNGDGEVSRMDLLRLAKYFSGWSVTLG